MASVLVSLLPLIIGSAVVPLQIIMIILILTSEGKALSKAVAFVLGMTVVRLGQGILFGLILRDAPDTTATADDGSGWIVSTILLILGILLLVTAYKTWTGEDDPDAPPPKWLTMMDGLSVLSAFGMGAGLILVAAKLWVFTLGAIGTIVTAGLGVVTGGFTFLLYILLAQSLLILPILVRVVFPEQSMDWLSATSDWLEKHNRIIVTAASLIFGALFFYNGISGLLT